MGLLGRAVLAFWHDIASGGDAEFNYWHTREHIPERIAIPGFLRGRRYEAVQGGPRYFNLYETADLATLESPAYVERLNNPTPWTRRVLPLFRNSKRTACRIVLSLGDGIGGALATLDLGPQAGHEEELRGWLGGTGLVAVADRPGIVGVHLCEADVAATQVKARTQEGALQDRTDVLARWVILVEGIGHESVNAACDQFLGADALARHGATTETASGAYRLACCLAR